MDLFWYAVAAFVIASAWIYALRFLYAMSQKRAEQGRAAKSMVEEIEEYVRKRRGIS